MRMRLARGQGLRIARNMSGRRGSRVAALMGQYGDPDYPQGEPGIQYSNGDPDYPPDEFIAPQYTEPGTWDNVDPEFGMYSYGNMPSQEEFSFMPPDDATWSEPGPAYMPPAQTPQEKPTDWAKILGGAAQVIGQAAKGAAAIIGVTTQDGRRVTISELPTQQQQQLIQQAAALTAAGKPTYVYPYGSAATQPITTPVATKKAFDWSKMILPIGIGAAALFLLTRR